MHCSWERKMEWLLWKIVWWFLKKLKIALPHDPAISFPDVCPKELKEGLKETHVLPLVTRAKTWKHTKYPLPDEWINKMQYIHTTEYYSSLKRKNTVTHVPTRMDLDNIMRSEFRLSQRIHIYTRHTGGEFTQTEQNSGSQGLGKWVREPFNKHGLSVWEEESSGDWLGNNVNVRNTTDCTLKTVKTVNFMLCTFYHHLKN